jgi:hypothetical protein
MGFPRSRFGNSLGSYNKALKRIVALSGHFRLALCYARS